MNSSFETYCSKDCPFLDKQQGIIGVEGTANVCPAVAALTVTIVGPETAHKVQDNVLLPLILRRKKVVMNTDHVVGVIDQVATDYGAHATACANKLMIEGPHSLTLEQVATIPYQEVSRTLASAILETIIADNQ